MIDRFIEILENNNTFLILTHKNPDGDALGSSLAMKKTLKLIGKDVDLYVQTPIPVNLEDMILEEEVAKLDDLKANYSEMI